LISNQKQHIAPARIAFAGSQDGVVFDCDGLLLETESRWTIAERAVVEEWGGDWTTDLKRRLLGRAVTEAAGVIAAEVGAAPESAREIVAALDAGFSAALRTHGCKAMPGAATLVDALRRAEVPTAVASNTRRAQLQEALLLAGLADAFEATVSAGDEVDGGYVLQPKPAPDVYLHACALLSLAPARTLALEDSPTGVAAARGAGLRVLGVPSLQDQKLDADAIVPSLASLTIDDATRELCWHLT
jgi:HAD superfamily hydrolase (TIGR01509 family)